MRDSTMKIRQPSKIGSKTTIKAFFLKGQMMDDEIDASFKNRRHNAPNLLD
jgi:hypothetical protein